MAQATTTESVPVRRIPKQPECNIGTAGHVDHGKCLDPSEYVLLNGRVTTGHEILQSIEQKAKVLKTTEGYSVYQLEEASVVSIDATMSAHKSESLLYVQDYEGPIYHVLTDSGRSIRITPEHPLLVAKAGSMEWTKAKDLRENERIAFLSVVPLSEPVVLPDPMPSMREMFDVVDSDEYARLNEISFGFTDYGALGERELNQIRLLAGLSILKLSGIASIGRATLDRILRGEQRASFDQLQRLRSALAGCDLEVLKPGEIMVSTKRRVGRWSSQKIRIPDLDSDIVKWFAFVWSRGSSGPAKLSVARTTQVRMLDEFFSISLARFGQRFNKASDADYHLCSEAFVSLLKAKFSYEPGNEDESGIADWVLGLSPRDRAIFLRWFFTLDGEFNPSSGQVMISQRNERNIVIIGYLLQSLGVVPSFGRTAHTGKRGTVTRAQLIISGRSNLRLFSETIGFENPRIQGELLAYLGRMDEKSEETNYGLPVNIHRLEALLVQSGLLSEGSRDVEEPMKRADWYRAYSALRRSGTISRPKLLKLVSSVEAQLASVESSLSSASASAGWIRQHLSLSKLSLNRLALESGITRRVLSLRLEQEEGDPASLRSILKTIVRLTEENLSESRVLLTEFRAIAKSPLEFDRVKSIRTRRYSGKIFDLSVPQYGNFVAGTGAILAHNTSLVQSITGVWASAHSEELKRGITIKVGYADAAFYKCPHTPPPEAYSTSPTCPVCGRETQLLRTVSFVDSPGHESLMTNMLAGAAVMDGAILVIAANEPVPMPQTREHMLALQMLGMKKMVIVQNKVDRVDADGARKNYDAIKKFLSNTTAADAPIIPVSAQHRVNIDALIEAIEEKIPTPQRDMNADSQMVVLRSFDVNRPGTEIESLVGGVLGGSVVKGTLHVGDEIEIAPGLADDRGKYSPLLTKVASLGTGVGMQDAVGPGGLVSLGTYLDPTLTKGDLMVGSLVGKPGSLPPARAHITTELQLFEQAVGSAEMLKVEKVRAGESLRLNIGTAATLGTVTSARDTVAELDLRKPVVAEKGSRVAISRRIAERWRLIGSGLVK